MKTFFFVTLTFLGFLGFSQNKSETNLGVKLTSGQIAFFGIQAEHTLKKESMYLNNLLFSLGTNGIELKTDYGKVIGVGFEVAVGERTYFEKKKIETKGFFIENFFSYGQIYFDKKFNIDGGSFRFDGKYQYISILNPSIGYKFKYKKLIIEPVISSKYNIEIKGKGSIDNRDIDNTLFSGGLRLAYIF